MIAAFVLVEHRVAWAPLSRRMLASWPTNDVQVAQFGADFLEEADVAGVEPVVAAGGDDLLSTRRGRHWRRFGKPVHLRSRQDTVLGGVLAAEVAAEVVGVGWDVDPNRRSGGIDFRQLVGIERCRQRDDPVDVTDRAEEVEALGEGESRRLSRELLERFVGPEEDAEWAESGGLLEEADIARPDIVEPAGNEGLLGWVHNQAMRMRIFRAPGTGSVETTKR